MFGLASVRLGAVRRLVSACGGTRRDVVSEKEDRKDKVIDCITASLMVRDIDRNLNVFLSISLDIFFPLIAHELACLS